MGKFLVSRRTNDEFQFNLLADNNEVILTSEGYASRSGCENGIDSVKENALSATTRSTAPCRRMANRTSI